MSKDPPVLGVPVHSGTLIENFLYKKYLPYISPLQQILIETNPVTISEARPNFMTRLYCSFYNDSTNLNFVRFHKDDELFSYTLKS